MIFGLIEVHTRKKERERGGASETARVRSCLRYLALKEFPSEMYSALVPLVAAPLYATVIATYTPFDVNLLGRIE